MKKRWLALLMVAALAVMALAGCGDGEEATPVGDAGLEEVSEYYYYSVQVRGLDEAILTVTSTDDAGEKIVEEVGSTGWFGTSDMTISQMMEEWSVESIVPSCEGVDFLGWIACEMIVETTEDGWEETTEQVLFDGKLFTTEEMMTQELTDNDVYFYTIWDLVCDECEEHKICEVYYVDDDRYFICDDCYPAFAVSMGWEE